jgi:hypothetical protein
MVIESRLANIKWTVGTEFEYFITKEDPKEFALFVKPKLSASIHLPENYIDYAILIEIRSINSDQKIDHFPIRLI